MPPSKPHTRHSTGKRPTVATLKPVRQQPQKPTDVSVSCDIDTLSRNPFTICDHLSQYVSQHDSNSGINYILSIDGVVTLDRIALLLAYLTDSRADYPSSLSSFPPKVNPLHTDCPNYPAVQAQCHRQRYLEALRTVQIHCAVDASEVKTESPSSSPKQHPLDTATGVIPPIDLSNLINLTSLSIHLQSPFSPKHALSLYSSIISPTSSLALDLCGDPSTVVKRLQVFPISSLSKSYPCSHPPELTITFLRSETRPLQYSSQHQEQQQQQRRHHRHHSISPSSDFSDSTTTSFTSQFHTQASQSGRPNLDFSLDFLSRQLCLSHTTHLHIILQPSCSFSKRSFQDILFPNITHLTLTSPRSSSLPNISNLLLPQLKFLKINFTQKRGPHGICFTELKLPHAPWLRELELANVEWWEQDVIGVFLQTRFPALDTLVLDNCPHLPADLPLDVIPKLTKLRLVVDKPTSLDGHLCFVKLRNSGVIGRPGGLKMDVEVVCKGFAYMEMVKKKIELVNRKLSAVTCRLVEVAFP